MVLLWYFLILLYQTDSATSQCLVENCDYDYCTDSTCTKCIDGYFVYKPTICGLCFIHCRSCGGDICYRCASSTCHGCMYGNCPSGCDSSSNVHCPSCPNGYYLGAGYRCYRCSHKQCKCSTDDGCTGCLPGKYNNINYCQDSCPNDCIVCTSPSDCSECVAGKYGQSCQLDCITTCQDGTCDKTNGKCADECPIGQYRYSPSECRDCYKRCSRCVGFKNCTSCAKSNYWGSGCQYDCYRCAGDCEKVIGCSSGCNDKFYQTYYSDKNGYECVRCFESCATCRNATECITCENGYWGSYCQNNCNGCRKGCNKENGCTDGCISGYYQSMSQHGLLCLKCSDNCAICSNATTCYQCEIGYYPDKGTNCVRCSDKCQTGVCSPSDGECTDGCEDGWSGHRCVETCLPNCKQCDQLSVSSCSLCKVGFYGSSCENNCKNQCKLENGHQTCRKIDGDCIHGCAVGYWGSTCSELCERGCKGSVCTNITGDCLNGCSGTYYGGDCENKCSANCETDSEISRQCNESNGSCEMGCKNGWFESNCSAECNTDCKDKICFQENGTCVIGYVGDFIGISTSAAVQCTSGTCSTSNTMIIGFSVGIAITTLIAAVAVTVSVILLIIRRRDHQHQASTRNTFPTLPQQQVADNSDYQGLDRNEMVDGTYSTITHEYENSF